MSKKSNENNVVLSGKSSLVSSGRGRSSLIQRTASDAMIHIQVMMNQDSTTRDTDGGSRTTITCPKCKVIYSVISEHLNSNNLVSCSSCNFSWFHNDNLLSSVMCPECSTNYAIPTHDLVAYNSVQCSFCGFAWSPHSVDLS
jgi:predicted Zn finger-like uncharacterized protein